MGCFEHCGEHLQRGVEGMRGAGSIVQAIGDGVQFSLGVHRQIGTLGQVLPQQPIGVLAGAALLGLSRHPGNCAKRRCCRNLRATP